MTSSARWLIAAVVVLLVLGLVLFARGVDHRRGDEVGAIPAATVVRA